MMSKNGSLMTLVLFPKLSYASEDLHILSFKIQIKKYSNENLPPMSSNILANDRFPFPFDQNKLKRLSTTIYFILCGQLIAVRFGQMRRDLLVIRFQYTASKNTTISLDYLNSLITMRTKNKKRRHIHQH
jgi:hypothetical protein